MQGLQSQPLGLEEQLQLETFCPSVVFPHLHASPHAQFEPQPQADFSGVCVQGHCAARQKRDKEQGTEHVSKPSERGPNDWGAYLQPL